MPVQVGRKLDSRVWDRHWRVAMERLDKKADSLRLDNIETRVRSAEQVQHNSNPPSLSNAAKSLQGPPSGLPYRRLA